MSYLENLEKDHVDVNYFIRLGSRKVSDLVWSAVSGTSNIFYTNYSSNIIPGVITWESSGVLSNKKLILAESYAAMVAGSVAGNEYAQIFYDQKYALLYINNTGLSMNPTLGTNQLFLENFFFVSTVDCGFHIKPDNENFPFAQYRGIVTTLPDISSSVNQSYFGFMPSQSGSISLANDGYLSGDFFEGSISNTTFEIYRCVGELKAENTQLVFRGFCRDCSFSGTAVNIEYTDIGILLDASLNTNLHDSSAQPDVINAVVRQFLGGRVNRCIAIDTDYSETKSSVLNRQWSLGRTLIGLPYTAPFFAANNFGSNTTTRTYLVNQEGLEVGTFIQRGTIGSISTTVYEVTAVGAGYIDHTALSSAMASGDGFIKACVQNIRIIKKEDQQLYVVDYDHLSSISVGGDLTFTFVDNIEPAIGINNDLHPEDYFIFADAFASCEQVNFPSTGAPLGVRSPVTYHYDNPIQVIYTLLYLAGFYDNENYYDTDSFEAAATACDIRMALASPRNYNEFSAESYRDVIAKICETAMIKLYVKNGKWKVGLLAPLGSTTINLSQENMSDQFNYRRLSEDVSKDVVVKYDYREVSFENNLTQDSFRGASFSNETTSSLNNNNKVATKDLAITEGPIADIAAERYAYLFSEPFGYMSVEASLANMEISLDDVVEIDPEGFPSLPFTSPKRFSVVSIRENENSVSLELFDQSGIETNSGDW